MAAKENKRKNANIFLTIALISVITIAFLLASGFSQSNFGADTVTSIKEGQKRSAFPVNITDVNETSSLRATDTYNNYSSAPLNSDNVTLDDLNSTAYNHPDMTGFFFSPPDNADQDQVVGLDPAVLINVTDIITAVPVSLDALKFATHLYGGYPMQQQNSTQLIFSFPDNVNPGQVAGTDALTENHYSIQKLDFNATFIAPKINALGFDEMAIFATSNTTTYKGTEFGIRMDLQDGFIYGYVQEPNDTYGDVSFEMQKLMSNDGTVHHYTLILLGSKVTFCIDGIENCYLNFPSSTDYSSLGFSICATVHRFTDVWDSKGDNMMAGDFFLNQ